MVKKTIPQLQEVTSISDSTWLVVDTGSVTKKIKKSNLQNSLRQKIRIIDTSGELIDPEDDVIFLDTGSDPDAAKSVYLPDPAGLEGKIFYIKATNVGDLIVFQYGISGSGPSGTEIDGSTDSPIFTSGYATLTLVTDGTDWFILSSIGTLAP